MTTLPSIDFYVNKSLSIMSKNNVERALQRTTNAGGKYFVYLLKPPPPLLFQIFFFKSAILYQSVPRYRLLSIEEI